MGLTFCKLAIEAHQGELLVYSEEGEGSTFYFTLPISEEPQLFESKQEIRSKSSALEVNFTAEEQVLLKPYIEKLQQIQVYEISQVRQIFKSLEEKEIVSKAVKKWQTELEIASHHCNEEKYFELLTLF